MNWIQFTAGMFVGAIFGAALMCCCVLSGRCSRREGLIRDLDREKRGGTCGG